MRRIDMRPARDDDAAALTRCIEAAYAVYMNRIADLPAVSEGIADEIKAGRVWVAELRETIAGGLVLIKRDGFALLANVAVDPAYSGKGLGRALIELAEAECRKLGLTELRLTTHSGIPENISFYKHLGWVESERSGNKVHMTKQL